MPCSLNSTQSRLSRSHLTLPTPLCGIVDPDEDLVLDAVLAEFGQPHVRFGIVEHARAFGRGAQHQFLRELEVAIIGDGHRNADADVAVGVRPVLDFLGHQILVRDQMLLAVAGDDADRAHADLVDPAEALSPTTITSPGLIERSISRMIPAIRLPIVFCRPKPTASPSAPENTAKVVRSMSSRSIADEEGDDDHRDRGELLREQLLGRDRSRRAQRSSGRSGGWPAGRRRTGRRA